MDMTEEIRESTWNICKQFDATNTTLPREIVHLSNAVTTTLERKYGEYVENLYREDWQIEVRLFAQKYGYTNG